MARPMSRPYAEISSSCLLVPLAASRPARSAAQSWGVLMTERKEAMRAWLRDILGINRYEIAWDFDHNGTHLSGRYQSRYCKSGMSKRFAARLARHMNRKYKTTAHVVVPFRPLGEGE